MDHLIGGVLHIIGAGTSKSFGAAYRALKAYDGRRVRWTTTAAAAFASAVYVPMVVGSFFAVEAVWQMMESEFFWFIGLILILPALLMVALALSAVGLGLTVGAWLLVARPGSRWYAGFLAVGALISGMFVLSMQTWASHVIGWSTIGLAAALLLAVLLPVGELPTETPPERGPPPDATPTLTQRVGRRRRFVL